MFKPGDRVRVCRWGLGLETHIFSTGKVYTGTVTRKIRRVIDNTCWVAVEWDEQYSKSMYGDSGRYWEIHIDALELVSSMSQEERVINKIRSLYRKSKLPFVQEWDK